MSTQEGTEQLFQQVPTVDILVNNLGIYEPKSFADISDNDWFKIFEANVLSGIRLSRHYLPALLERNWGRIIFISSESGVQIPAEMIHYGVTKTAQLAIARGLAETTVGTGVTVNSVLPGPTRSEGVEDFVEKMAKERGVDAAQVEKEFFESVRPSSLIKRFATTEEVCVPRYLCRQSPIIRDQWCRTTSRWWCGAIDSLAFIFLAFIHPHGRRDFGQQTLDSRL